MRVRVYSFSVLLLAVAVISWLILEEPPPHWHLVVLLGAVSLATEVFAVKMPHGGTVSLMFAIAYSAILLGGPLTGVLVAIAGAVSPEDLASKKPPHRLLFNVAQLGLAAAAAGLVYTAAGGSPLYTPGHAPPEFAQWILPAIAAAPVYAAVNIALVIVAIALHSEVAVYRVWQSFWATYVRSLLVLTLLGLVLAQLVAVAGLLYLLLLALPFVVSRQTFRVYQQQEEAYIGTVRSLVAALEAKDPYTRGHTERVASYAGIIAGRLGLNERETKQVEWASLLHDIGKVAVSDETLSRPGKLSTEEFCAVREHPRTAALILEEIEFLSDIAPYVTAHHERIDGNGYPSGLSGDDIPLGARILAVADVFDAMTSSRSYRAALSFDEAIKELRDSAGDQLDPMCVEAFVDAVAEGVLEPATGLSECEGTARA